MPPQRPRRNPFKSTAKGSWDVTTHSEESYLKMGLPGTSLGPRLGTSMLGNGQAWRSGVTLQSPKTLFGPSRAGGVCCQGLAPGLSSFQHPFEVL